MSVIIADGGVPVIRLDLFGNGTFYYDLSKKPCWFHRKMMTLLFGFKWVKPTPYPSWPRYNMAQLPRNFNDLMEEIRNEREV